MTETTTGTLLGGRVHYDQPASGFRSGIEPVLLAAAIATCPGERVLEGGCGAGAGLLCLAARVPGIVGVGIEADAALVRLARRNAEANGAGLTILAGDIDAVETSPVRHAFANPPYHLGGTASPDDGRERAKRADATTLPRWTTALAKRLEPHGTLTLILPASLLDVSIAAFAVAGCGSLVIAPLWPRAGRSAKLVLIRAIRGGRSALVLAPGLVLHDQAGFTPETDAILRGGQAFLLAP